MALLKKNKKKPPPAPVPPPAPRTTVKPASATTSIRVQRDSPPAMTPTTSSTVQYVKNPGPNVSTTPPVSAPASGALVPPAPVSASSNVLRGTAPATGGISSRVTPGATPSASVEQPVARTGPGTRPKPEAEPTSSKDKNGDGKVSKKEKRKARRENIKGGLKKVGKGIGKGIGKLVDLGKDALAAYGGNAGGEGAAAPSAGLPMATIAGLVGGVVVIGALIFALDDA